MKKMNRLAIIPARSGSKRIKNKNIKNFLGKPIICYPLDAAIQSKLFKKIHVSTNDKRIKNIVKKLGLKIDFMRPSLLSKDKVGLNSVLKFVVRKYESLNLFFDEVWLIYACSPLIKKDDLIKANKKYQKTDKKFPLMSVREYDAPIQWAFKKKKTRYVCVNKKKRHIDSKNLDKNYFNSANFEIYKKKELLKRKRFFKFYGQILPRSRSMDIDDNEDWKIAEALYTYNLKKS